jgi:N-carbamoylputrescine amidase
MRDRQRELAAYFLGGIITSMSTVTVAAMQMACSWDRDANIARGEKLIREAAGRGAQVILLQELFETPYFCKDHLARHLELARPLEGHPAVEHFRGIARELGVVLPISIFERANNAFYNSVVILDADGAVLGHYRKAHIPESPGYHEKFYFSPGDTGFQVFHTRYAKLGVAICWDQWFPEAARCMALMGAEILLYPTAIGSEPQDASIDSSGHWQRTMQGHAAANVMPLVASNRIGTEKGENYTLTFYGSSFIASATGEKVAEADRAGEAVLTASFDLDEIRRYRQAWGVFRDRRPDLYYPLLSLDGRG